MNDKESKDRFKLLEEPFESTSKSTEQLDEEHNKNQLEVYNEDIVFNVEDLFGDTYTIENEAVVKDNTNWLDRDEIRYNTECVSFKKSETNVNNSLYSIEDEFDSNNKVYDINEELNVNNTNSVVASMVDNTNIDNDASTNVSRDSLKQSEFDFGELDNIINLNSNKNNEDYEDTESNITKHIKLEDYYDNNKGIYKEYSENVDEEIVEDYNESISEEIVEVYDENLDEEIVKEVEEAEYAEDQREYEDIKSEVLFSNADDKSAFLSKSGAIDDSNSVVNDTISNVICVEVYNIFTRKYEKRVLYLKIIPITNILISKRIRYDSSEYDRVKNSIKKIGLIEPILVTPASNRVDYVLIHGYNRLRSIADLGIKEIPCLVVEGDSIDLRLFEVFCNMRINYSLNEIVDFCKYLEQNNKMFTPSQIDEIVGFEEGTYLKLKAVLEYGSNEIINKMMTGKISIDKAYKLMEREKRKQEATNNGLSEFNNTKSSGLVEDIYEPEQQTVDRRPLSKELYNAVKARDNYTCQCCGIGGAPFANIMQVHHIKPVFQGGNDALENLVLVCLNCHKLIHDYGFGLLYIDNEEHRRMLSNVIKYGEIIREGFKQVGKEALEKEKANFKYMEDD